MGDGFVIDVVIKEFWNLSEQSLVDKLFCQNFHVADFIKFDFNVVRVFDKLIVGIATFRNGNDVSDFLAAIPISRLNTQPLCSIQARCSVRARFQRKHRGQRSFGSVLKRRRITSYIFTLPIRRHPDITMPSHLFVYRNLYKILIWITNIDRIDGPSRTGTRFRPFFNLNFVGVQMGDYLVKRNR